MYFHNVWLTVKDSADVPKIQGLLARQAKLSRAEPGCHRFEVYHSQADETRFLLVEHWETKADWETHRTAQAVTEIYIPHVIPFVERDSHPSTPVEE